MKRQTCSLWHAIKFPPFLLLAWVIFPHYAHSASYQAIPVTPSFISSLLTATLLFSMALMFFVHHWRQKRNLATHPYEHLPPSLAVGYYFYDIRSGVEIVSDDLKAALQLPPTCHSFNDFRQCFSEEEFLKLKTLCETGIYSLADAPPSIILQFSCPESAVYQWLECSLSIAENAFRDGEVITLWFSDISQRIRREHETASDNRRLKTELQQLRAALDNTPSPIWLRNEKLEITYGNSAYKKLISCKEGAANSPIAELDDDIATLAQEAANSQRQQNTTKHIITDGQLRLFHLLEIPPSPTGPAVGIGYDITTQEEIQKELEFHISVQSDLLESSSSAMAIYGANTHLKFFNQAFVKLWDLDETWLASQPTYSQILDTLREKRKLPEQINFLSFKQEHLKLFTDLTEPYNEFFHLPDGRSIRTITIPHAFGGLLFAYEDMTDRLALERSYNMLAAVQKATLDNLTEGIAVIGQNGRLKLFNPSYAKMWHHDLELLKTEPHFSDLVEKAHYLYKHNDNWIAVKQRVLAMLSNREHLCERVERTDGSVIDRQCIPLPDGATMMSYLDVTDSIVVERSLRELNKALQEADEIKTEFLANVSYELRSPLTSIMGLSEALEKQYFGGLNDRQKEYVQGIHSSSQQLMSLINDILDLTSIEAGHMELDLERFSIHAALSSVKSLVTERMKEADITFVFNCSPSIGTMVGDERRIKQTIFKLLSNAIEFTPPNGKVTLTATKKEDSILLCVEDTGDGIALEDQQSVFNKFYRTETARINGKAGAGLGLSVVKNFIELHNGEIILESSLNVGTIVSCILPQNNKLLLAEGSETQENIHYPRKRA